LSSVLNGNLVGLSGTSVLSQYVKDTVCIKGEGYLNLWYSSWCRRDSSQVEATQKVAILGELSLSFEYLNGNCRLVICIGGESLSLLGWDSSVSLNKWGHNITCGLNTQSQWSNVNYNHILLGSSQYCSLDSSSNS